MTTDRGDTSLCHMHERQHPWGQTSRRADITVDAWNCDKCYEDINHSTNEFQMQNKFNWRLVASTVPATQPCTQKYYELSVGLNRTLWMDGRMIHKKSTAKK